MSTPGRSPSAPAAGTIRTRSGLTRTARDRDRSIRANLQKFREGRDAAQRRTAVAEWTAMISACDWLATRDEIAPSAASRRSG